MDLQVLEWLNLVVRWTHLITGIAWIGSSFFFVWLDLSLRKSLDTEPSIAGETWLVHGGGFYVMRKYSVAPEAMPDELHWFKYEAYFTWITGFFLLGLIYYVSAETYLIDPRVLDLGRWSAIGLSLLMLLAGWVFYDLLCRSPLGRNPLLLSILVLVLIVAAAYVFTEVFSDRAAFVHIGAMVGSMMVANVYFVIIPNQKKTVAALVAGETPDPMLGYQAKQRSTHNNYLTLPVLLMMISNHYPAVFGHDQSWAIAGTIVVLGGVVRHYFNSRNEGQRGLAVMWQWPVAALVLLGLVVATAPRQDFEALEVSAEDALAIAQIRCATCHAAAPTDPDFPKAPAGVMLETPELLRRYASKILAQSVLSEAMPLGNKTGMTEEERRLLGAWIRSGTPD